MKTNITQIVNYDVSAGDKSFGSVVFQGDEDIIVQFFFSSLNRADHKIRLQESLDGINFADTKDSAGNNVEIVIDNALSTDILRYTEAFNSNFIRFQFIEGTAGTGTIDNLKILME